MPSISLAEIARAIGGRLQGDSERLVSGVATLQAAGPDHLSLVADARYAGYVHETQAAAVLVPELLAAQVPETIARIVVGDPHAALADVLLLLYPEPPRNGGIHPTAVVDATVDMGEGAEIGAYAIIRAGCKLGSRSRIGAHCVVGEHCTVGEEAQLHPGVVLYGGVQLGSRVIVHAGARLGADGFGYVWTGREHRKVPQVGGCIIGDDVEIGANTTIDRGSIGNTVIGRGTKIDNLVHIGHNVEVGEHVIVIAQVGVSGSTAIGDGAILAGQAGIAGHLRIGAGARVAAQAGVIGDVPPGVTVSGYPARPHKEAMRASAGLLRLPKLVERIRRLERAVLGAGEA